MKGEAETSAGGLASTSGQAMEEPDPSRPKQGVLWMGGLDDWMDEGYVANLFAPAFLVQSVKLMRRSRGRWRSYAFVDFGTRDAAAAALRAFAGRAMPGTPRRMFRLNWAEFGLATALENEYSLFIGDLDLSVADYQL